MRPVPPELELERADQRRSCRRDAGCAAHALDDVREELPPLRRVAVRGAGQRQMRGEDVLAAEARVDVRDGEEAADHQRRADEQHERDAELYAGDDRQQLARAQRRVSAIESIAQTLRAGGADGCEQRADDRDR